LTGDREAWERDAHEARLAAVRGPAAWTALKSRLEQRTSAEARAEEAREAWASANGLAVERFVQPGEQIHVHFSATFPELMGLSLGQAAERLGASDPWEAARQIYLADEGRALVGSPPVSEDDVQAILAHPLAALGTDGVAWDRPPDPADPRVNLLVTSPNGWSTFPKVLGGYARDLRLFSLETAVHKMTGLPARFLGLRDRGLLAEGYRADIAVFDACTVASPATPNDPCAYPVGIRHVLVNGRVAIANGDPTGQRAGRVLARPGGTG
jgi:N-acyl-D-aspartate/D-glutamate deacylase